MSVKFQVEKDGFSKNVFAGFSWTTFFFGFWVPIFRKDFKGFLVLLGIFVINIILNFVPLGGILSLALSIYVGFWYNKSHFNRNLAEGFNVLETDEYANAIAKGYALLPYTDEDKNEADRLTKYRTTLAIAKSGEKKKFWLFIGLTIATIATIIVLGYVIKIGKVLSNF